jgi:hypothetical protein
MRGHQDLIALRRKGVKPPLVWLSCGRSDGLRRHREETGALGEHIEIDEGDIIERLDLRCLVGLAVDVSGDDRGRVLALAKACEEAGASRVIAWWDAWERRAGEWSCHSTCLNDTALGVAWHG